MPLEDFYADPHGFLQANVVRVPALRPRPGREPDDPMRVRITPAANQTIDNTAGGVFDMSHAPAGAGDADSIECIFCQYAQGATRYATLTDAVRYMFTPQMDGCTFGVGHAGNGALIVGHSNAADIGLEWDAYGVAVARARQRQSQITQLQSQMDWKGSFVTPADYMTDKVGKTDRATTFGVRGPSGWNFYTARYRKTGSFTIKHRGVHAQINNMT